MKRLLSLFLLLGFLSFHGAAFAQSTFTISAFNQPQKVTECCGTEYWYMKVKPTTAIFGCTVITLRITGTIPTAAADKLVAAMNNAQFLMASEVISAAKNAYPIDVVARNSCDITDYYIQVQ